MINPLMLWTTGFLSISLLVAAYLDSPGICLVLLICWMFSASVSVL